MTEETSFATTALQIAGAIYAAGPGDLAETRRMDLNIGTPILWRLAPQIGTKIDTKNWAHFAQLVAIMTPLAKTSGVESLNVRTRSFGHLLADGGDTSLSDDDRPVVSEPRFTSFLLARGPSRDVMLERLVRQVKDGATSGLDIVHFAALVHGSVAAKKRLVRDFYDTAKIK